MYGMFFDTYDTPVYRPPSEAASFILRVTRGCAHNNCTYCNMYRGVKFEKLSDEQIMHQIELARVTDAEGVRRVFLADGDALVLPTGRLLKILAVLKEYFPNLERVASYAAPGDILRKSVEELTSLRKAGLTLLYYGMESGDSQTLKEIRKGVSGEQSIEVGKRAIAAGMQLSIMVILGIAGAEGSERHALATAHAINEIKPTMLSALSLMLYRGSELPWNVTSQRAEVSPGGVEVELIDDVRIARTDAKNRPTIITSSRMTVFPQKQYAQTEQAVRIDAANGVTTAQGMKAYLNDGRMLLQSNVRGQHEVR